MIRYSLLIVLLLAVLFAAGAAPAEAANTVFVVNDTNDLHDINLGDGVCGTRKGTCTLRAAIQESNASCGGDYYCEETIELPAGLFKLTRAGADDSGVYGDLDIKGSVTIKGAGAANTIIDANPGVVNDRIFQLHGDPLVTYFVTIEGITLQNGRNKRGGAIYNQGMDLSFKDSQVLSSRSSYWGGGAIYSEGGRLDVIGSTFAFNKAEGEFGFGGAIYLDSSDLYLSGSWLVENRGDGFWGYGGAIYGISSGLAIDHSTVEANYSADYGGGIYISNGWLHINKSTIKDNYSLTAGGGIMIGTAATFELNESTITGNMADINLGDGGGGLYLSGDAAEINDSEISHNAAIIGGGILQDSGETTINRTTISENNAVPDGGGIYHRIGKITITASTLSYNQAFNGAGAFVYNNNYGTTAFILVNSTLSGNVANGNGGGIYNDGGTVSLYSSTVATNQANGDKEGSGFGGGFFSENNGVSLLNTILADNFNPGTGNRDDCWGKLYSEGYNLIESGLGCNISGDTTGNINGGDPQLEPLQDNGGSSNTETQAIPLTSPAVEAGNPNGCTGEQGQLLEEEQRGSKRHLDGDGDDVERCDIGAYENGDGMWP